MLQKWQPSPVPQSRMSKSRGQNDSEPPLDLLCRKYKPGMATVQQPLVWLQKTVYLHKPGSTSASRPMSQTCFNASSTSWIRGCCSFELPSGSLPSVILSFLPNSAMALSRCLVTSHRQELAPKSSLQSQQAWNHIRLLTKSVSF